MPSTAQKNTDKIEHLYKEVLSKKHKYKDRAKKYKNLLRKRDKEIMDLVVESKDLRTKLDKDHSKHSKLKDKLK